MMNIETKFYTVSKLNETTFLVWDKSKNIPTPHYYKTLKSAYNKCKKIHLGATR